MSFIDYLTIWIRILVDWFCYQRALKLIWWNVIIAAIAILCNFHGTFKELNNYAEENARNVPSIELTKILTMREEPINYSPEKQKKVKYHFVYVSTH